MFFKWKRVRDCREDGRRLFCCAQSVRVLFLISGVVDFSKEELKENDWQPSDQQQRWCRRFAEELQRISSVGQRKRWNRCWEERRSSCEGFLGEEARTPATLLGCGARRGGDAADVQARRGRGRPSASPGNRGANTAPRWLPNWVVRIARLFRNHSNLGHATDDGARQLTAQLTAAASQPVRPGRAVVRVNAWRREIPSCTNTTAPDPRCGPSLNPASVHHIRPVNLPHGLSRLSMSPRTVVRISHCPSPTQSCQPASPLKNQKQNRIFARQLFITLAV